MLGCGSENVALVNWLIKHRADCRITICDALKDLHLLHPEFELPFVDWRLGPDYDKDLSDFDLIFRVPGYPLFSPPLKLAAKAGAEITSPTKLFFEFPPTGNTIGVTGSKGKGTTSGLITDMLSLAGLAAFLGGNIGTPIFDFYDQVKPDGWVVLELSSFQLEDLEASPHIAVITNLMHEHLQPADPINPNYHLSEADYQQAKLNIVKYQTSGDIAIFNKKIKFAVSPGKRGRFDLGKGKKIYFDSVDFSSRLVGGHNKENIAAAAAAVFAAGVKIQVIKKAAKKFRGLPHRIELAGESNGIKYYDDSFATTPEAAITALRSFDNPIILLAGGADKGADFGQFAREAVDRVKFMVLFDGKATPRIESELKTAGFPKKNIALAMSMPDAMRIARAQARSGDIILLSPGCASFGIFKNYKERGDLFKEELKKYL